MLDVVRTDFEVRWGECDPAGIVYHPAYLDWFSVARMRFLQAHGISYMRDFHDRGMVVVVLEAWCRYQKALRAEDRVHVDAWWRHLSRTRFGFEYQVVDEDGKVCASGRTEHAFLDLGGKPVNLAKRSPDLWQRLQQIPVRGEA